MYTTKEAIENFLLTDIDASFDSQIESWITAMSEHIEAVTGRKFIADDEASPHVDECAVVPSL